MLVPIWITDHYIERSTILLGSSFKILAGNVDDLKILITSHNTRTRKKRNLSVAQGHINPKTAIAAPTEPFQPNTPSTYPLRTISDHWNHQITSTSAAHPGSAPYRHIQPVLPHTAVIVAKHPTATAHNASDNIHAPKWTVSLLIFNFKRRFSINVANNLIKKFKRLRSQPIPMQ
jgi:hypothetical protein